MVASTLISAKVTAMPELRLRLLLRPLVTWKGWTPSGFHDGTRKVMLKLPSFHCTRSKV